MRLSVEATGEGATVTATGAGSPRRFDLAAPGLAEAAISVVQLAGGARVALLRASGAGAQVAGLFTVRRGRPEMLWSGRLDAVGDLSERRRDVVDVADRTGDGIDDVVVGVETESTRICGQTHTLLLARAVDPTTLELRPVVLRRLPEDGEEVSVDATLDSPGPEGTPLLPALHFGSASSSGGSPEDPALVPAPTALADGRVETLWTEGRAGVGRWEFATARWSAGSHAIRAVALTLPSAGEGSARNAPPRALWLVGDQGPRVHVTIPASAAGHRVWVFPPEPLRWSCLSVVLDDTAPPVGVPLDHVATSIAEVEAFSDLDFGEGIESLAGLLARDDDRGTEAARLLASLGERGVGAVVESWPTLSAVGRRRGVRVLADNLGSPRAQRGLVSAARDEEEEVRTTALAALVGRGAEAAALLAELAADRAAVGDDAAVALARLDPVGAAPVLLAALDADGGSERPGLRRALATAVARGGQPARGTLSQWGAAGPSTAAAAAAALALARERGTRELSAELLLAHAPSAARFEDRWRLAAAAARLPAAAETDRWLEAQASAAEEWMMRAAAVDALASRRSPRARPAATVALGDEYPRVRVAALGVLGAAPESLRQIAQRARRDSWPMVRAAAVEALGTHPQAGPIVRAAVADNAMTVRTAAIRGLTRRRDRVAWSLVRERLGDDGEWPDVLAASVDFAQRLCVRELAPAIEQLVRRGTGGEAWAPDEDLAVRAAGALVILGAEDAIARVAGEGAPPALVQAVRTARERGRPCR